MTFECRNKKCTNKGKVIGTKETEIPFLEEQHPTQGAFFIHKLRREKRKNPGGYMHNLKLPYKLQFFAEAESVETSEVAEPVEVEEEKKEESEGETLE